MRARDRARADAKAAKEKTRHDALMLVIRRTMAEHDGGERPRMSNGALAARAGVSRRTLQRWLHRGEFIRAGKIVAVAVRKEQARRSEAHLADIEARLNALIKQHRAARVRMPYPF